MGFYHQWWIQVHKKDLLCLKTPLYTLNTFTHSSSFTWVWTQQLIMAYIADDIVWVLDSELAGKISTRLDMYNVLT